MAVNLLRRAVLCGVTVLALGLSCGAAQAGERLDAIKARGFLTCGVGANVPGFSQRDASGVWHGFDVDMCRAIAAGIFGDATKIRFKTIDTLVNFMADRDIDLVLRGLTWTSGREISGALRFGPIILYDGQGFLVPKKLGISSPEQLSGKSICASTDAAFLTNVRTYFRNRNLILKAVIKDRRAQAADAFFGGECEAMTADASELAEAVIDKAPNADDYVILPQQITKEPLAPLLRKGDDELYDAVRWTIFALINAEELGVRADNIEQMRASDDPDVKFFFAPASRAAPGLSQNWTVAAVQAAGNYGEIFDRNLGAKARAKLPRGLSRLWTGGGVLYAPPIR
jgi:general L-amino acid transport system substrate-binding protein